MGALTTYPYKLRPFFLRPGEGACAPLATPMHRCMRAEGDHFRSMYECLIISYSGSVKRWTQKYTRINTNKYRAVGNVHATYTTQFFLNEKFVRRNLYDVSSDDGCDLARVLSPF